MSGSKTMQELNEELARKIHEEARRDLRSPYANKFVGIANGQVVAVADELDELMPLLRQSESDPKMCSCVRIDPNGVFNEENAIWESR